MSPSRQTTLKDIARACGVSRATASFVVCGSPLVHADTRRRVETEMRRQGYVYNRTAANLRQRVSTTVALVAHDLSNPFLAEFALGADEALNAKGYGTLPGNSNESPARQYRVLESLMEYRPAGSSSRRPRPAIWPISSVSSGRKCRCWCSTACWAARYRPVLITIFDNIPEAAFGIPSVAGMLYQLASGYGGGLALEEICTRRELVETILRFASAAGALTVTKRGAFNAMPTLAEVEALLVQQS